MASLVRNSIVRFAADSGGLLLGVITSVITARWLGPAGKGLLSTLTFLSGVVAQIFLFGLSDTAIVRISQRKSTLATATAASLAVALPAGAVGAFALWAASLIEFRHSWTDARVPVLVACVGIPLAILHQLFLGLLNSQEWFVRTSSILLVTATATTVLTVVLILGIHLSVTGGVLAVVAGTAVGLVISVVLLARSSAAFRPRLDPAYLRFAFSYGPKLQISQFLVIAAARFDLLLVYSLAGQASAGQYSIALTASAINGMLPLALVAASFPRLAAATEAESLTLAARISRMITLSELAVSLALMSVVPVLLPFMFGKSFAPAVVPTVILLAAGPFAGVQYHLCRAWAARGNPGVLFRSFAITTVVMLALDLLLIPHFGTTGAACASLLGSAAGCVYTLAVWIRGGGKASALIPRSDDVRETLSVLTNVLQSRGFSGLATRNALEVAESNSLAGDLSQAEENVSRKRP